MVVVVGCVHSQGRQAEEWLFPKVMVMAMDGDTRSFRRAPLYQASPKLSRAALSQNILPLLRAGAHVHLASPPCLITIMGMPGCRWAAGVGCWARGRVMEPHRNIAHPGLWSTLGSREG